MDVCSVHSRVSEYERTTGNVQQGSCWCGDCWLCNRELNVHGSAIGAWAGDGRENYTEVENSRVKCENRRQVESIEIEKFNWTRWRLWLLHLMSWVVVRSWLCIKVSVVELLESCCV